MEHGEKMVKLIITNIYSAFKKYASLFLLMGCVVLLFTYIYDSTGRIWVSNERSYETPTELNYLEDEVPQGKLVESVDINETPNVAVPADQHNMKELTMPELPKDVVINDNTISTTEVRSSNKVSSRLAAKATRVFVTPEEFGAVGDGKTNNSKAFTKMFNYASSNGCCVTIPPRTYLISSAIDTKGVSIIGKGKYTSTVKGCLRMGSFQTIKDLTVLGYMAFNSSTCKHVDFINVNFDGNNQQYSPINITDSEMQYITFYNCEFHNAAYGLNVCNKGDAFHIHHITVRKCYFHDNKYMNIQFISRAYTIANVKYGYHDILLEDSVMIGVNYTSGIYDQMINVTFDGYLNSSVPSADGIGISRDVIIRNCKIKNGFYALELPGCGNVLVENCDIERSYHLNSFIVSMSGNPWIDNNSYHPNIKFRNCRIKYTGDLEQYSNVYDCIRVGGDGLVLEDNEIGTNVQGFGIGTQSYRRNIFSFPVGKTGNAILVGPSSKYRSKILIENNTFNYNPSSSGSMIVCYGGTSDSILEVTNNKVITDIIGSHTENHLVLHDVTESYLGTIISSNNIDRNGEIMQIRELNKNTLKTDTMTIQMDKGFDIKINPDKLNNWGGAQLASFRFEIYCEANTCQARILNFEFALGKTSALSTMTIAEIPLTGTHASEVTLTLTNNNYTLHVGFTGAYNDDFPALLHYEILNTRSGSYTLDKSLK